ncbi:MAG TPA: hypothetical protein VF517_07540 [Thermoleophilaceae bacterium]
MPRLALILVALLAAAVLVPGAASATPMQESASAPSPGGEVAAQLTYDKQDEFQYSNVRIKITRGGAVLLDAAVPAPCDECPTSPQGGGDPEIPSLVVRDLNGDGEPEALVDLYTGGAHCCSYTQIYGYHAATNAYRRVKATWGDFGYQLTDLNKDGKPEFRSSDFRFAGAFTAYAASGAPPMILNYTGGKLVNNTRKFRREIKKNLKQYVALYKEIRKDPDVPDVRGFLAAYVADKYLLGQGDTAFDLVYAALRRGELKALEGDTSPAGKKYISALRKYLRKWGYR